MEVTKATGGFAEASAALLIISAVGMGGIIS